VGLGLLYALLTRERLQVNVLADRNPQFVVLSDGSIRNGYTVKLLNMIPPRTFTVTLKNLPAGEMNVVGMDQQSESYFTVEVEPDSSRHSRSSCVSLAKTSPVTGSISSSRSKTRLVTKAAPTKPHSKHRTRANEPGKTKSRVHRPAHAGHHGRILLGHHYREPDDGISRPLELDRLRR
jgi:hypothetical protein